MPTLQQTINDHLWNTSRGPDLSRGGPRVSLWPALYDNITISAHTRPFIVAHDILPFRVTESEAPVFRKRQVKART